MENRSKGGFAMLSPFSTTEVIIYKESDCKCQVIVSISNPCISRGGLNFAAGSGEMQKLVRALHVELAIPPQRDLYGEN
jgi:hypothetical protein